MSANAEQPGTSTCSCGNVIKIGTIYAESSRGAIECASCGSVAIRWGSPDAEREKRIEAWTKRILAWREREVQEIEHEAKDSFAAIVREAVALMRSAPVEPKADDKSVAEIMLDRWRERRKRCLTGVAPTVPEIEAAMSSWSTEVIVQKAAPEGSAMRRAVDAADRIIGLLWKHVESLRERFDYEMDQRDELHASYVQAIDERDDVLSRHKRLDAAVIDYRRKERELLNLPDSAVEEDHIAAIAALRGERDAEAGKVNADLLAAAKDLAVKAKAYVDQSWELERLRCDDAVAAFNAVVQRAEEAGRG